MSEIPVLKIQHGRLVNDGVHRLSGALDSPEAAVEAARRHLAGVDREYLVVLLLNTQKKLMGMHTVAIGTLNEVLAHPREVFKPAVLASAHSIILAHNHPSGDVTPSPDDKVLYRRIKAAGETMEIELLDSIIIGDGTEEFYSHRTATYE